MKIEGFKYVVASEADQRWGLYLNTAGTHQVTKRQVYPVAGHPADYAFSVEHGRVLNEYQLNYITNGYGLFQNAKGVDKVSPGTIIVLKPGEWHNYRPLKLTGWTENYIGFSGALARIVMEDSIFAENSLINMGINDELLELFVEIRDTIILEKPAHQNVCAGLTLTLLAKIIALQRANVFAGSEHELIIQQARKIMRERISENLNIEELSSDLGMGYSLFRQIFKKYTGMAPLQYHMKLRMKKAEELLLYTRKPIKSIAFELGFESLFYFSRIFKTHVGCSPRQFRK